MTMWADWTVWSTMALAGLIVGSICKAVIHRLSNEGLAGNTGWLTCPSCGGRTAALQKMPIASWVLLRGSARCCGAAVPRGDLVPEVLLPVLWVLIYSTVGLTALLPVLLLFAAGGVCVAMVDIATLRIPHPLSDSLAGVGVVGVVCLSLAGKGPYGDDLLRSILVPVACGLIASACFGLWRLVHPASMGGGDVWLAFSVACVGALGVGWEGAVVSLMVPLLAAGLASLMLLGTPLGSARGISRRTPIPFGPFLVAGGLVGAMWGQGLWDAYLSLAS